MVNTLLALALAPMQFAGGSPADLAASIESSARRPAMVSSFTGADIAKFDFDATDLTGLSLALRQHAKMQIAPGVLLGVHQGHIDRSFIMLSQVYSNRRKWWVTPEKSDAVIENGTVTIQMKGRQAASITELSQLTGIQIKPHWTMEFMPVSVSMRKYAEADYVALLAKTVGARSIRTDKSYSFELEPNEWRNRARKTILDFGVSTPQRKLSAMEKGSIDLTLFALGAIPNNSLLQAFETPGSQAKFPLTLAQGKAAFDIIQRTNQAVVAESSSQRQPNSGRNSGGRTPNMPRLTPPTYRVDTNKPITMTLTGSFQASLELYTYTGNGDESVLRSLNYQNRVRAFSSSVSGVPLIPPPPGSGGG